MSEYVLIRTEVPNLVIDRQKVGMTKSIVINNPQLELEILSSIAALDGSADKINISDFTANPAQLEALANRLQGLPLYLNDICTRHQVPCFYYDMDSALQYLQGIRNQIGAANFANSKVVFEELLLGLELRTLPQFADWNFDPEEPPHHMIVRAYNIPKTGSSSVRPSINALPVSRQTKEILFNLEIAKDGQPTLVTWTIENPDRELRLLREIASSDGDSNTISAADIRSNQQKITSLEGYRLYTNDPGTDATQTDLNAAYALLHNMNGKFDLSHVDVLMSEKMRPDNDRRIIQNAQVVFNESGKQNFADFSNFGL
ncbi:MAG: hypothetical protein LBQ83_00255 [Candidatus Margulisbacteria bacterium]|nr:hypothetical protein [Candidatus Margulisiibacteriota bacterium]